MFDDKIIAGKFVKHKTECPGLWKITQGRARKIDRGSSRYWDGVKSGTETRGDNQGTKRMQVVERAGREIWKWLTAGKSSRMAGRK